MSKSGDVDDNNDDGGGDDDKPLATGRRSSQERFSGSQIDFLTENTIWGPKIMKKTS